MFRRLQEDLAGGDDLHYHVTERWPLTEAQLSSYNVVTSRMAGLFWLVASPRMVCSEFSAAVQSNLLTFEKHVLAS